MQKLFELIFSPILDQINSKFSVDGFDFTINIKFIVADKPARSMMLNMQSTNAEYMCPVCLCTSCVKVKDKDTNTKKSIFIPYTENPNYTRRTHSGFSAVAYSAQSSNKPEYGIKGTCFLQNIVGLDLIECNIFDYMHSVCLGIFKSITHLLFFSTDSPYSYRSSLSEFDATTKNIKFPSNLSNVPPLLSNVSMWKAKDYRSFFLFCFPIFFYGQFSTFENGISKLCKGLVLLSEDVSKERCEVARKCFQVFLKSFEETYGENKMTANFHDLYHLPEMALSCGSLCGYSGFNFEHINGRLSRLCKGNKRFDLQISRKITAICDLPDPLPDDQSDEASFLRKIFSPRKWKTNIRISESISICGIMKKADISQLQNFEFFDSSKNYSSAERAVVRGKKVSTESYAKKKTFNNSCMISKKFDMAIFIEQIIIRKETEKMTAFVVARSHKIENSDFLLFNFSKEYIKTEINLEHLLDCYAFAVTDTEKLAIFVPKLEYY